MINDSRISMIGGGSWATALVKILNENHHIVNWWMRNEKSIEHLQNKHRNPHYLSSLEFQPEFILPSADLEKVISAGEIIFLAVPAAFLKGVLKNCTPENFKNKVVL